VANNQKAKKPNIFIRLGRFFKASWSELKKVSWPTWKTVLKNTSIVLLVVLAFSILILGADQLFTLLLITLPA
jgi:preprotein translocase subunit SecE